MAVAHMPRASDPLWLGVLVESLMTVPDADGVSASTLARAWRDARERVRLLNEVEMRAADDCGGTEIVAAWIAEKRVIALVQGDALLLPAFQFDRAGNPRPEIAQILAALNCDAWTAALWFRSRPEHLGEDRPMDVLADRPHLVVTAARQDAQALPAR